MPYTYKSLALVWLTTFALFALTASGVVGTRSLLPVILGALAAPFIILRTPRAAGAAMESPERPPAMPAARRSVVYWLGERGRRIAAERRRRDRLPHPALP